MSRETTEKRNRDLNDRYVELYAKKTPKGRPVMRHAAIVEQLAHEFYLSEARVDDILKER